MDESIGIGGKDIERPGESRGQEYSSRWTFSFQLPLSLFHQKLVIAVHIFTGQKLSKRQKTIDYQRADRELSKICIKEIAATYGYPDLKLTEIKAELCLFQD